MGSSMCLTSSLLCVGYQVVTRIHMSKTPVLTYQALGGDAGSYDLSLAIGLDRPSPLGKQMPRPNIPRSLMYKHSISFCLHYTLAIIPLVKSKSKVNTSWNYTETCAQGIVAYLGPHMDLFTSFNTSPHSQMGKGCFDNIFVKKLASHCFSLCLVFHFNIQSLSILSLARFKINMQVEENR